MTDSTMTTQRIRARLRSADRTDIVARDTMGATAFALPDERQGMVFTLPSGYRGVFDGEPFADLNLPDLITLITTA